MERKGEGSCGDGREVGEVDARGEREVGGVEGWKGGGREMGGGRG